LSTDQSDSGARSAWFYKADQRGRLLSKQSQLFQDVPVDPPTVAIDAADKAKLDALLARWRQHHRSGHVTTVMAERNFAAACWCVLDDGTVDDDELDNAADCDGDTIASLAIEQCGLERLASTSELSIALAAKMRLQQLDTASESKRSAVATIRRNRNAQAACT
jgi:hypothetical protein